MGWNGHLARLAFGASERVSLTVVSFSKYSAVVVVFHVEHCLVLVCFYCVYLMDQQCGGVLG